MLGVVATSAILSGAAPARARSLPTSRPSTPQLGLATLHACTADRSGPALFGWCRAGAYYGPLHVGWLVGAQVDRAFNGLAQVSLRNQIPPEAAFRGLAQIGGFNQVHGRFYGLIQVGAANIGEHFYGLGQIGLLNTYTRLNGLLQLGLLNVPTELKGMQVGLLNVTEGYGISVGAVNLFASGDCGGIRHLPSIYGLQLAALTNLSAKWYGIQIGPVNLSMIPEMSGPEARDRPPPVARGYGLQVGLLNSGSVHGLQVGLFNDGKQGAFVQVGAVNRALKVTGLQLGAINICERLSGIQIGLLNIARSSKLPVTPVLNASF